VLHIPQSISVLCVFTFLQTVIKELNLKFKTKENPHGIKSFAFKVDFVNYAEKYGNRAAEMRFDSPPTEKMIQDWKKQRKELIRADKSKIDLRSCAHKFPKLEEYIKNWLIDHSKKGIDVSTKMILIESRRLAIEMSITDFAGTTSWCERFMRRNGLRMRTKTTIAQKCID
jgi:oligoribonuclease (3'-5' exoribonuclease)